MMKIFFIEISKDFGNFALIAFVPVTSYVIQVLTMNLVLSG